MFYKANFATHIPPILKTLLPWMHSWDLRITLSLGCSTGLNNQCLITWLGHAVINIYSHIKYQCHLIRGRKALLRCSTFHTPYLIQWSSALAQIVDSNSVLYSVEFESVSTFEGWLRKILLILSNQICQTFCFFTHKIHSDWLHLHHQG